MSAWEAPGKSDEWYTPKWIFDALGCTFDMDVAGPAPGRCHVPSPCSLEDNSLHLPWRGFVWMNPPFGGRNAIEPWLAKFFKHGNGIALTPDRTSAPWFQEWCPRANALLFLPKVKFLRPDGSEGKSPSTGTVLWACGLHAATIVVRARDIGLLMFPWGIGVSSRPVPYGVPEQEDQ